MGDGGDATGFVIAVGKLTAVGENLAQQLTVTCGIAITCLVLAGGIGLGNKLTVLVIFPLGVELGGGNQRVVDAKTPHLAEFRRILSSAEKKLVNVRIKIQEN